MRLTRHTGAIAGLLAAAVALSTAGCGRTEDAAGGESAEAEAVADGAAEGTITVWAMGAEGENLEVLGDAFTAENPDATVEVTAIPWDAAHDKISTAIAAGETPDVSLVGTTWMGEFASTGALEPTPTDLIPADRFFEGPWGTAVFDGTAYGVPWYTETRLIYYRTDLAEQAGITEPPATWDDLKALAEGMQQSGAEYGINLQSGQTGAWQTFMPFAWQNGADIKDGDTFALDSEQMIEAFEYFNSFFTSGLSPTALDQGELEPRFVDGRIGAFVSGPWHMSILDEQGGEEFRDKWSVAHMPEEEAGTSFVGGGNLVVFENTDNREAAWKFVEYLTRPDVQQVWYDTVSDLPTNPEAWESGALADDERLATFGAQLEDAKSPPVIAEWEQVADALDSTLERINVGGEDPAEAATALQGQAESIGGGG